mmetsp:Transcript_12307/g.17068  ORF Transcript_12307/g.17068 Transcript_12307/m.17068 type:complete len:282 (-) Transcript_12307:257-1102(-)
MGCKCSRPNELGTLVLVAKFPTPKKSKTRLGKLIGYEESASFALAALEDLLCRYARLDGIQRVLLFAPTDARAKFESLLKKHRLQESWALVPMLGGTGDTTSSDLGAMLKSALERVRNQIKAVKIATSSGTWRKANIAFIGSDCLELSPMDIRMLFGSVSSVSGWDATILPAKDGGYVALCLGENVPSTVFDGVKWSDRTTCVSQMQALSRNGVQRVHVGDTFEDIDELEDLKALFERTSKLSTEERQLRSISRTYCFLKNMYSTTTAINDDEKTRGVILE